MASSSRESKSVKNNKQVIRRTWFLFAVCGLLAFIVSVFCLTRITIKNNETDTEEYFSLFSKRNLVEGTALRGSIYDCNGSVLAYEDISDGVAVRVYPGETLACHVLGAVTESDYGPAGVESSFSQALSSGYSLILTLDAELQTQVETSLQKSVRNYDAADGGCVIVMEANTGKILAMASMDNFDCSDYTAISDETRARINELELQGDSSREELLRAAMERRWVNTATETAIPVGTWFQSLLQAVLLEEGYPTIELTIDEGGDTENDGIRWNDITNETKTEIFSLIAEDENELIAEYLDAFGLNEICDADLSCDDEDDFPTPSFTLEDFVNERVTASPLQLLSAFATLVNGGVRMRPYLVDSVLDAQGNLSESYCPIIRARVISTNTSDLCRYSLSCNVMEENGSARNARVTGYAVGALTADMDEISIYLGYSDETENGPLVMIYTLYGMPEDNLAAESVAPAAAELFSCLLSQMGALRTYSDSEMELLDIRVPSVCGVTVSEAEQILSGYGLKCDFVDLNEEEKEDLQIVAQIPSEGTEIARNSRVRLYTASPTDIGTVQVPSLQGFTYEEAEWELNRKGLFLAGSGEMLPYEGTVIVEQSEPEGSLVSVGTVISVSLLFSAE